MTWLNLIVDENNIKLKLSCSICLIISTIKYFHFVRLSQSRPHNFSRCGPGGPGTHRRFEDLVSVEDPDRPKVGDQENTNT